MSLEENIPSSKEEIVLELAINSALIHFQEAEYEKALPFIQQAIEICDNFQLTIPNLYLIKSFSEMQLGRLDEALESINYEIELFPSNERALRLKEQIEDLHKGFNF
ncbi:MAG: hypothetical protein ACUVQ1_07025 [Candidatus Kapaibacteriales bacterium]